MELAAKIQPVITNIFLSIPIRSKQVVIGDVTDCFGHKPRPLIIL
jgi:hypothetical protein